MVCSWLGGYELKKPTPDFYVWLHNAIRPIHFTGRGKQSWLMRFDAQFVRDLPRVTKNSISMEGALSSLCELSGMGSPGVWKFYYSIYEHQVIRPYDAVYLSDYQPPECQFSLRLAKVDPVFFECYAQHGPPKHGCIHCHHRPSGCVHCFKNSRLTYKQAARKNLRTQLPYHSKCRGAGCCVCYNKTRDLVRSKNIARGIYSGSAGDKLVARKFL
jgi:hypothetical protein